MAFTPYLSVTDYPDYGISDGTDAQVAAACRVVNTFLSRPEGLVWSPDANGVPAYMANLNPTLSITVTVAITPGSNVVVTVPNRTFGAAMIGEVAILDRDTADITEACVVTAASGDTLTFQSVQFPHPSATLDFGLTLLEELPVPSNRTVVRVSRNPMANLLAGFGRYATGRRSQQFAGPDINNNLLAYVGAFGGPPLWTQFPVDQTDINFNTGEVWIPAGLLLAYFTDVRLRYIAGWSQANLPTDIKQAVANIVRAVIDNPFGGNFKSMKAGDAAWERFSASALDLDTQSLLTPYRAMLMR
jgi:hypothetical protein